MEEILKKIYVKLSFLYKKYLKRDSLISQIESEIKNEKKKIWKEYIEKKKGFKEEREKGFLANRIGFNLNSGGIRGF